MSNNNKYRGDINQKEENKNENPHYLYLKTRSVSKKDENFVLGIKLPNGDNNHLLNSIPVNGEITNTFKNQDELNSEEDIMRPLFYSKPQGDTRSFLSLGGHEKSQEQINNSHFILRNINNGSFGIDGTAGQPILNNLTGLFSTDKQKDQNNTKDSNISEKKSDKNLPESGHKTHKPYFNPDNKKYYNKNYLYKNTYSVRSYALILYCKIPIESKIINKENIENSKDFEIKVLLQQRRDTFEYSDFLPGTWKGDDPLFYFCLMSNEERNRIRNYTIRELWDDHCIDKTAKIYKDGFKRAKERYESVKHLIPDILDKTESLVSGPPWGFPKGRKASHDEKDYECAIRETEEETKLPRELYENKLDNRFKFYENYKGTNGINYSTCYFVARLDKCYTPGYMETSGIRKKSISEEVCDIVWVGESEFGKYLFGDKLKILEKLVRQLKLDKD